MPRQIDLFPQNLQVNYDPTKQLGITQQQINSVQNNTGPALEQATIDFINSVLSAIDQATGWDLLSFAKQVESGLNITGNLATDLWNYIFGAGQNATTSLANWTTVLEELGLPDQTAVALVSWLQSVYTQASDAWNNWVTALENLGQTTVTDFTDLINAIDSNASDAAANWTTVLEDLGIPAPTATSFVSWLQTLLTPNSQLNASNLWGLIPSTSVTSVPAAAITASTVNPLFNPDFQGALSISPGSGWSWDSTVYYTPPSGDTSPGSAKVTADGNVHALRSNLIDIDANQTLSISLPILAHGLSVTGSPLELDVVTYNNNAQTGITTLTTMGAPTGATTGWTGAPTGSVAGTISGTYTAPSSGVTQVQIRLAVDGGASAGTVWWGNATASISGGVIASLQTDLGNVSTDITDIFEAFGTGNSTELTTAWDNLQTDLQNTWDALFGITTPPSNTQQVLQTAVQDLGNAWTALFGSSSTPTTGSQVLQTAIQDLDNAWTALFGSSSTPTTASTVTAGALPTAVQSANTYWSTLMSNLFGTTTPQTTITTGAVPSGVPATKISNVLGGTSLGADVQAILDYIANALGHTGTGHTLTQIETYLGLIPATNVTNVLGGANLGADVSSVNSTSSSMNTWWSQLLTELGITPGGSNGTNVGSTISTASTNASSAVSTATSAQSASTTNTTNLNNTWSWLFGTTTPTSSNQVNANKVTNVLGNTDLGTDLTQIATQLFGSAAVNNITTVENDIINFLSNAITGGNAPTSGTSTQPSPAATLLDAFSNIPHTNVMIPPSPGSGSITHDANASATGYHSTINNYVSLTWNHTCGSTANYLVVRVGFYATSSTVVSVSYNGSAMQLLQSEVAADGFTTTQIYGLPNPPTGSAYSVNAIVYAPFGNYIQVVAAESDSYIGVGSVRSTAANVGHNTSPSLSVPSFSGDYIVQGFTLSSTVNSATMTSYNRTSQYNSGSLNNASGANVALLAGDAAGASSVSFTATATNPSPDYWAAAAASLIPLPAATLGSGFRSANTSTSAVSAASGSNSFPNSFFNATVTITPDGTYNAAAANSFFVGHAGWYNVTIAVLLVGSFTGQLLGLNLLQTPYGGSTATKRGHTAYVSNPTFSTVVTVAHTFQVYCSPGDILQPGYYCSTSGSAFTGTSDGLSTYFEVSLNNRSLM